MVPQQVKSIGLSLIDVLDHSIGHRLASLYASALHQSVILPHQQLGLDLLQGIQDNTYHNQQGSTSKEGRKALGHVEALGKAWQDTYQSQQNSTWKRDLIHHGSNEISSGLSRLYTRNKTIVTLQVISNLFWIKYQGRVQKGKCNDDDRIDDHVKKILRIGEYP